METRLIHGGDWAGFGETYGRPPLDFSANSSPLGVPEGVRQAIVQAAADADRYPDPLCRALGQAIAGAEGVAVAHVLCGSGAADLIYRSVLALRPRQALVTAPTFAEYEGALHLAGCAVRHFVLEAERDFRLDRGFLEAVTPETDVVFLCQPNNPTGVSIPRPLLLALLERCRETGTRLILDECFCGFLDRPGEVTLVPWLERYPQLLILKAFTKLYGMAGVRLGYALCADEALLERMRLAGQPWEVSSLAQAAGIAALAEEEYVDRVRTLTAAERPRLLAALTALGLRVVPGEANYLLFQSRRPLLEPLARQGILLRGCANYRGLDGSWYRTAVRTAEENTRLIAALKEVLA